MAIDINERIAKEREKLKYLVRQKKAQEARDKKKQAAINKDRHCIIGKIVSDHFPEVLEFRTYRTEAENKVEFAPLVSFLSVLAADLEVVCRLKEQAINQSLLDDQQ